jgi:hypothetical protein
MKAHPQQTLSGMIAGQFRDPFAYLREALPALFALGEGAKDEQLLQQWLPDAWLQRRGREPPQQQAAPA